MACPASGKITIQDLVNEFGGSAPHALSEYYRNGGLVPGNNTNVAESGQISLTQFYSAVNEILHTHSNGDTHADYSSIFGSNWASTVPKRVVVPSGVTVGGTSTHAMLLPSGMGGTIVFDISGNVQGSGGAANGGAGGNAIHCAQTSGVTININSGATVKAGGGGGGQGGQGGAGGQGGTGGNGGNGTSNNYVGRRQLFCHTYTSYAIDECGNTFGHGYITSASGSGGCFWYGTDYNRWYNCYAAVSHSGGSGGAGGAGGSTGGTGGAGGVGQGYGQSATSGSSGGTGSSGSTGAGGSSGGTSAGTGGQGGTGGTAGNGGTGGAGGSFGNSGANGNAGAQGGTGAQGNSGSNGNSTNGSSGASGSAGSNGASGQSGGAAGYYIYNRNSITLNNSGTVAGQ